MLRSYSKIHSKFPTHTHTHTHAHHPHSPQKWVVLGIQKQCGGADVGNVLQTGALLVVLVTVVEAQRVGHTGVFNGAHRPAGHGPETVQGVKTKLKNNDRNEFR